MNKKKEARKIATRTKALYADNRPLLRNQKRVGYARSGGRKRVEEGSGSSIAV